MASKSDISRPLPVVMATRETSTPTPRAKAAEPVTLKIVVSSLAVEATSATMPVALLVAAVWSTKSNLPAPVNAVEAEST